MLAIEIREPGGPEVLVAAERPEPEPGPGQLLIEVKAAGVNRPDVLQRQGRYDPPKGESDIPGLELAGTVAGLGPDVSGWRVGDRVMALVGGGAYAERCVAPAAQCLPIPDGVSFELAGALPETWFTVWANVFEHGGLKAGETLLVHGGSSGIGHAAIQLAVARGAKVITTSGSDEKVAFCRELGAELAIHYRNEDFVERVKQHTDGRGADVVLDMVGGDYLPRNLDALAFRGRHVSIATLRGAKTELLIPKLMAKQAVLTGSFLRARPPEEKARIARELERELLPLLAQGTARPHVDRSFELAQAAEAHRVMDDGRFLGKLVLVRG